MKQYWSHPDTQRKRQIAQAVRSDIAAQLSSSDNVGRVAWAVVAPPLRKHRLAFYDALEVLAILLLLTDTDSNILLTDSDNSCETAPLNILILDAILEFADAAFPKKAPSSSQSSFSAAASTSTLLWSLHPFLLATLSRHYFRVFHPYITILIAWTRREIRGMISLCLSSDSAYFSAPDYLWASSLIEDVNGFNWPSSSLFAKEGDSALLKRVADLKNRWKTMFLQMSTTVSASIADNLDCFTSRQVLIDIIENQLKWLRIEIANANLDSLKLRRMSTLCDLSLDDIVECETCCVIDDGGLESLRQFWESFFDQILNE